MHSDQPQDKTEAWAAHVPGVPLTLEGSAVLHQMMRLRRAAWRQTPLKEREAITREAVEALSALEESGYSAIYALLGHKADWLWLHFRESFDELAAAQAETTGLRLWDYLETTGSFVSVVELGLYESTVQVYRRLAESGVETHSEEWNQGIEEVLARQRKAMASRLWPRIPPAKYLCYYPMNRKRDFGANWYSLPLPERQRLMHEHGLSGRRYGGEVRQIISGSIGYDDWEWGVDLFADDPLVFKKLVYDMRFDEVSAAYAEFGPFYFGLRRESAQLPQLLALDAAAL